METGDIIIEEDGTVGSYRTYEEWKHVLSQGTFSASIPVLTVPMRNGNSSFYPPSSELAEFLPYL